MKIPVPKCPVCDQIGKYQNIGQDYTVFLCNKCNLSYAVGGTIPEHIPDSQIKLWVKMKNSKIQKDEI
jgi:ribosomal protein L37AE/L43A